MPLASHCDAITSILFIFKVAGKVFRVGVLMTVEPPKIREILGWLREKSWPRR